MIELLAIPEWDAPPRPLPEWIAALGPDARLVREADGETWIEVPSRRFRAYVVIEDGHLSALNFELSDPDPAPATDFITAAARSLAWEVHADDEEEEEGDD